MLKPSLIYWMFSLSLLCSSFALHSLDETTEPYLKEADINQIFNTHVKVYYTEEYMHRYVPLPLEKNNLPWRWETKDFARIVPLLEFEKFIKTNNISSRKALAFNGINDPEWYYITCENIVEASYLSNKDKYDLHNLQLPESGFDFVMLNNTLEHVYDPIRCLRNIYRYMDPNGILYVEVPVNSMPHDTPWHYYTGFTPTGLGAMAVAAGFRILHIGQWGNHEYLQKMYATKDWPDYRQFANPGFNDLSHPISAWIFAIKD